MNEPSLNLGPIMKAARKFKKFNQSDVAHAIGCSQSALSKMEHNLLVPSAPQWFLFSRFTSIPPETIETGIIDRKTNVQLNNEKISLGYRLPKRYRLNRAQKVREIYPFLAFLEKKADPDAFKQFMESVGIESEFFIDFDNLINFQLNVDLINLFDRMGKTSESIIKEIVEFGQSGIYWDGVGSQWKTLDRPEDVLEAFAKDQLFFQADFKLMIEYKNGVQILSYVPEPHLYHFLKDLTDSTRDWLNFYRKFSIEHLVKWAINKDVEARLVFDRSSSPLASQFEIHPLTREEGSFSSV